ncbi:RlpA-like double-psi beta-barrel-protein domain-containing protein-containing protein [Mycena crocata]|nr:RlpA-like double-psi beta-barrel-protein domain-containing protein-containing protein [Mycena crocata]
MRSVLFFLVLALPFTLADHQPNVNHRELAKRAKGDIEKRGNARWSFYATGLGACGGYNKDSDFIVALNQQTFGYSYPGKYCGKKITMTYNGKTTTATIVDSCPGCPSPYGLDLSPGLFSFFASQDDGIIYGSWSFQDGSGGGGDNGGGNDEPTTTKKTTTRHTTRRTTSTTHTTPTSTYTPPTTTSTTKTSTTTTKTSTSATPSSTSSESEAPTSASSNSLAAASGTVSATSTADPENLYTFAQVILDLTGVVVAGANAA